jgi:3-methylcrotonyl-CoA carboxylase alpha subunit
VEARVYAEDPEHGFIPSTGRAVAIEWPAADGVRVDAGVESGSEVTPYYDPMLAKIIAHASTRDEALKRLAHALEQTVVAGPRSNLAFLLALCRHERFRSGAFDTGFIDRQLSELLPAPGDDTAAIAAGIAQLLKDKQSALRERTHSRRAELSPWDAQDAFQLSGKRRLPLVVSAGGRRVTAEVTYEGSGTSVSIDGVGPAADAHAVARDGAVYVLRGGRQTVVRFEEGTSDLHEMDGGGVVRAPMHGKVLALFVEKGQSVEKGQRIAVIEAMKMEHMLTAAITGVVAEVTTAEGAQVAEGAALVVIEPAK